VGVKIKEWKGAWWVFVDHQGRRKAKRAGPGLRGRKLAEAAATKIAAKLLDGDTSILDKPPQPTTAPMFADVAEEWLRKYPALHAVRPATMDNYRSFTERHLIPFFGSVPVSDITAQSIEDFIEAKRAPGGSVRWAGKALSDGSLRTGLLALRLILQRAVRMKVLPANPIKEVEWRGTPRIDQVDPFSGPELRALLAAARRVDLDFAALLQVWAQSGMRAGEVCGLEWQDVDLEAGTALIQRTWSRHRLGPPKTGPARKVSFLHPVPDDTPDWRPGSTTESRSAVTALRRLTIRSMDPEAFVFGRGRAPRSSMDLHRAWRRVMAAAKVRYRAPEQLRHTFASTMLSRNAPLLYVQAQGGWRSASVLLRVYARWMPHEFSGPLAVLQPVPVRQAAALPQPAATPAQPEPLPAVAAGRVSGA
jgi:integrase